MIPDPSLMTPGMSSTPEPSGTRARSNIEVIILSHNEALNLPHALRSVVEWADAVHVVDSGSTDGTQELAREMGANVVVQPWLGYARQKNWALETLPVESEWVFILDADESVTPQLRDEMLGIAARPSSGNGIQGYYVNRLTYFFGKPIRHCGFFPSYNLRFFRKGQARYEEREVHEHMIVNGPTERLVHLMHHEDRRGLEHWIAKHNRYSTLEAREIIRDRDNRATNGRSDSVEFERGIATRRWLKRHVLPRLPFSGLWRFFYMYFIRLGFLDGVTGFRFCVLLAVYDLFISMKLAEFSAIRRDPRQLEEPAIRGLAIAEGHARPVSLDRFAAVAQDNTPPPRPPTTPAPTPAAAPAAPRPPVSAATTPVVPAPAPAAVAGEPALPQAEVDGVPALRDSLAPERMPPGKWPATRSVPVSILVPVKNEERNIVECLRRCQWATQLVVVDSQSSDKTIGLSQAMGAEVYQFYYDRSTGWPKKKNWALDSVKWQNDWVMILDADEYMTPELAEEIRQVVSGEWAPSGGYAKAGCGDGYWVNRRFMFMSHWLKGCGYYPSWNVRLFRHEIGRYERIGSLGDTGSGDNEVHEHVLLSTGEAGYLRYEFLHYAYPDLSTWIEKHNRYTTWEAHAMEAKHKGAVSANLFGQPIERRRWLKKFARSLPFRPTLRFFYSYVLQRGFLDGYPGLVMCRLLAWYEFMSIAKYRERVLERSADAAQARQQESGRPLS